MRAFKHWTVAAWLVSAPLSCREQPTPPAELVKEASFGVLYGGQVQRREEIPFQLDSRKQRQGFRIELNRPLEAAATVEWEVSRPGKRGSQSAGSRAGGRVTELLSAQMNAGQSSFEQQLAFKPGDPLGLWNLRVVLGGKVVLDRPFSVFDAHARAADIKAARVPDAGL